MTPLLLLACTAQIAVILAWTACLPAIRNARRRACRPLTNKATDTAPLPATVTVVLPARDEQDNLAASAQSVLAQRGALLQLVIVDDRSSDATPQLADRLAAADPRCHIIHNHVLPSGWLGKSHACALGAARARGDWLLFLDADVRLHPDALRSAVHYAHQHRLDLISLWLRDGSVGFLERLLVPLCGAMIVIWYGRVAARNAPRGRAFANGQFFLIRRAVYESVGGHVRVRTALIEDIPLARAVSAAGFAVGSAIAPDLATVRMYRGLRAVFAGWKRIYVGVLTPAQLVGCILSLLVGSAWPIVALPVAAAFWFHDPHSGRAAAWTLLTAAHLLVLAVVSIRFFALVRCRLRYLWLYPLSVVGVLGILAAALEARLSRRAIRWRGTTYDAAFLMSESP